MKTLNFSKPSPNPTIQMIAQMVHHNELPFTHALYILQVDPEELQALLTIYPKKV